MNIIADQLTKTYGSKVVLDGVSLSIEKGKVLGLLGPNGAGKSTTIKILSGQITPSSGNIVIDDKSFNKVPNHLRGKIGVMPQEVIIWDDLNILENLLYSATLLGVPRQVAIKRANFLVEALHLQKELKTLARNLSGGYKRRVNLAISIIHEPSLLFLDEPTPGIDAQSRRFLMDYIRDLSETDNYAIVLTDHYLDEAEKLSDYVVIIDDGKIIAEGTVPQIKQKHGNGSLLVIEFDSELDENISLKMLSSLEKSLNSEVTSVGKSMSALTNDPVKSLQKALDTLKQHQLSAQNIAVKEPSLEDVFLLLTGKEIRE